MFFESVCLRMIPPAASTPQNDAYNRVEFIMFSKQVLAVENPDWQSPYSNQ